mgnify:CR=1 FL=1
MNTDLPYASKDVRLEKERLNSGATQDDFMEEVENNCDAPCSLTTSTSSFLGRTPQGVAGDCKSLVLRDTLGSIPRRPTKFQRVVGRVVMQCPAKA